MRHRGTVHLGNTAAEMPHSWTACDDLFRRVLSNMPAVELLGRLGNKTTAADKLNITANALSSRFRLTEELLGGSIVEPNTADLAPIGKALRKYWQDLSDIGDKIVAEIARLHDSRILRVAVSRAIWEGEKERIASEYARRMPDVVIVPVYEDGYLTITNQVLDGEVDVGIVSCRSEEQDPKHPLASRHWRKDEMVLVVGADLTPRGIAENIAVRPGELEGLHDRFYMMPEHTRMHELIADYMKKHRIGRFFRHKIPRPDVGSIIDCVSKGHGVSILPEPVVKRAACHVNVEMFLLNPSLKGRLDCIYRQRGLKTGLVSAFLECIEDR